MGRMSGRPAVRLSVCLAQLQRIVDPTYLRHSFFLVQPERISKQHGHDLQQSNMICNLESK